MAMKKKQFCSWDSDLITTMFSVKAGLDALERLAYKILEEAQAQCPVDNDHLRSSGKVIRDEANKCIWISFGDDLSAPYAVKQHERVDFHHKVGNAKFLKIPYDANRGDAANMIAEMFK